jgi:hypothetical protein
MEINLLLHVNAWKGIAVEAAYTQMSNILCCLLWFKTLNLRGNFATFLSVVPKDLFCHVEIRR